MFGVIVHCLKRLPQSLLLGHLSPPMVLLDPNLFKRSFHLLPKELSVFLVEILSPISYLVERVVQLHFGFFPKILILMVCLSLLLLVSLDWLSEPNGGVVGPPLLDHTECVIGLLNQLKPRFVTALVDVRVVNLGEFNVVILDLFLRGVSLEFQRLVERLGVLFGCLG